MSEVEIKFTLNIKINMAILKIYKLTHGNNPFLGAAENTRSEFLKFDDIVNAFNFLSSVFKHNLHKYYLPG